MKGVYDILRGARWSELLFAVLALYLALGLPVPPPDGRTRFLLVHWYGMAVVAFGLVVALRRPSRGLWAVALTLSVYFLISFVFGMTAWRAAAAAGQYREPAIALSYVIVAMAALAQVSVALRCWRARAIWIQRPNAGDIAPVA